MSSKSGNSAATRVYSAAAAAMASARSGWRAAKRCSVTSSRPWVRRVPACARRGARGASRALAFMGGLTEIWKRGNENCAVCAAQRGNSGFYPSVSRTCAILPPRLGRYNPQKPRKNRQSDARLHCAASKTRAPAATPLKRSDFHYDLPPELIAQAPLPERSASRLLVVPPLPAPLLDRGVRDLPDLLRAGDLLVFNDTRVIPARLHGQKSSGGRVEILIERLLPDAQARVQLKASKSPRPGARIALDAGGEAEVLGREGEFYRLRFHVEGTLEAWLQHAGRLPLPPYIQRAADADDDARYQTVFARETGAV